MWLFEIVWLTLSLHIDDFSILTIYLLMFSFHISFTFAESAYLKSLREAFFIQRTHLIFILSPLRVQLLNATRSLLSWITILCSRNVIVFLSLSVLSFTHSISFIKLYIVVLVQMQLLDCLKRMNSTSQ